jgi:PTH1 family peptidyl-tRNA hydrolase
MLVIAGLGNPGAKYTHTRHNIGFLVIDTIAKESNLLLKHSTKFHADIKKQNDYLLVKPTTFMNNSGLSLQTIKNFYKISNEQIVIVHDDLDLPFGSIRFKIGGSSGGHNGLKSLDAHIGADYIRVRIGIGKPKDKAEVIKYVLNDFTKEELNKLKGIIQHSIKAIFDMPNITFEQLKSKYTIKGNFK